MRLNTPKVIIPGGFFFVVVIALFLNGLIPHQTTEVSCPDGYVPFAERKGTCILAKHPEPLIEIELRQRQQLSPRSSPFQIVHPNAFSAAVAERNNIVKSGMKVKDTAGVWEPYGRGPLISNDPAFGGVNGLGLVNLAGRIDSLFYDSVNNRLFAAQGTGGIWLSENLGETWRSIGDQLPSQIVGAVAWTPANSGTIIVVSGDHTFGGISGYTGYGAFYSTDLGATWQKATGVPDGALSFAIAVDPTNPHEVYAGTMFGLFRSTDGGKSYVNVVLPTGPCAGVEGGLTTGRPECHLANVVTDIIIKSPGGVNSNADVPAGTVLATVGWRGGQKTFTTPNGLTHMQSPNNGIYRSTTGEPGTFTKLAVSGFTPQDRIGRVELGATIGALQDHDYVYAIVQDAVALNGGLELTDGPNIVNDPRGTGGTNLHGIYVSADFGQSWILMADDYAIAKNPATGSGLAGVGQALFFEPGVQAWYNEFVAPDPTRQTLDGIPTRLVFGLEEVWQNEITAQPMNGPATFKVIGRYFSDEACMLIGLGLPECPTNRPPSHTTTTHPDQHDALWVPAAHELGGVTLLVGNDGGFYKQHAPFGVELDNAHWGDGHQNGFNTLLPYDLAVAKDGIVWAGLQDNGHMKIRPTGEQLMAFGGDGTWASVDPNDSRIAYQATPGGSTGSPMQVTINGGAGWRSIAPPITNARFVNRWEMDPTDANHLVTAGNEVVETVAGPNTADGDPAHDWVKVFDLGTASKPGDPAATATTTDPLNQMSTLTVYGDAVYVGFCGTCDILNNAARFKNGLATNVGGSQPPQRMTANGWRLAGAQGLPNRFITGIAIDPTNVLTIYVTLGGYSRRWIPPGVLQDDNANIGVGHLFKSTDGGETFVDISGNLPDAPAMWVTLRAKQIIVGTEVGVFASDLSGKPTYAPLTGLPVAPVSTMELHPNDPNVLLVATFGRGVWKYTFAKRIAKPGDPVTVEKPPAPAGVTLAGPFAFELGSDGWTSTIDGPTTWRLGTPGDNSIGSFQVVPYSDDGDTSLVSPVINHPGGWAFLEFRAARETEPGFDFMQLEYSSNGGPWQAVPWVYDRTNNIWRDDMSFDGRNPAYPGFDSEKIAVKASAGTLSFRFRLISDALVSSPLFKGISVDNVAIKR
ncbi:hypothetical protein L0222_23765 [bacterium]|nr:hypothetical protein [bacterium]MCI0604849.1 hypothetical protein [bacterium]